MRLRGGDRGALVVPGIVKIAVALGVLGVLGYDTFETIATHLKAESDAQNAAYAGSSAWNDARFGDGGTASAQTAYDAANTYLTANKADHLCGMPGDHLCDGHNTFVVDPDGTVHLIVRREASTLVFGHLGFMHRFLVAYEEGDANSEAD